MASQSTKCKPKITKLIGSAMFVATFSPALTTNNLPASNLVTGGGR